MDAKDDEYPRKGPETNRMQGNQIIKKMRTWFCGKLSLDEKTVGLRSITTQIVVIRKLESF